MRPSLSLLAVFALAAVADAADSPPAVTTKSPVRVWVDQIGYRTTARKLAIVAGDQALPSGLALAVCKSDSLQEVWSTKDHADALRPFNDGKKDGASGDFVAQLDFSDLKAPGRYVITVTSDGKSERSYAFNIGDAVYQEVGLAAWKTFYYQRADCDKPEKYAGAWNHAVNHRGPNQATEAKLYKWEGGMWFNSVGKNVEDPTPHDVTGGWWDAGDFNKYMGNTVACQNDLLLGYQLLADAATDNQLNIPESGNGVPDMLDEIRYCTDFLIRLADADGAGYGRVHEDGTCPPEKDTSPVQLTQTTSGATMGRACALAYAAVVWKERKLDQPFVDKCQAEALKSWKVLQAKPHPWPADAKDPKKEANTGAWFSADYNKCRALFAACMFRLTGEKAYDDIVHEVTAAWKDLPPGEGTDTYPTIWVYGNTDKADPELAKRLKQLVVGAADKVIKMTGASVGYAAAIRGYWWGSNRSVGQMGFNCLVAERFAAEADRKKYRDAAEEYVHYLLGRNAIGLCFLSNLKAMGAEHSVMVMFHSWVGKDGDKYGAKYIGEGEGKIGPFPAMVVGGTKDNMKHYVDVLDWRQNPWEYNEPDITYQSPCAITLAWFGLCPDGVPLAGPAKSETAAIKPADAKAKPVAKPKPPTAK